jgi:hypothetical protein
MADIIPGKEPPGGIRILEGIETGVVFDEALSIGEWNAEYV